jgi:hypothetical protein
MLLRRVPVFDESMQPIKVGLSDEESNAGSHAADSHAASPPEIPFRTQALGAISLVHAQDSQQARHNRQ